ncbi:acyl-CoA N-acyltransferase [Aspergillus insuetus]
MLPNAHRQISNTARAKAQIYDMASNSALEDLTIGPITEANDFPTVFEICAKAFGEQTADGIWTTMNPGWETPEGKVQGAARMEARWRATRDAANTTFLKASLSAEGEESPRIVGVAIWIHASLTPGHGDAPEPLPLDFSNIYPHARFLSQLIGSMQKQRRRVLQEKTLLNAEQKSVMILDLCALDPAFQRRGIAAKLVQWGLEEAQRLGNIEAITEASRMGRSVYKRLGFQEVAEIEYEIDDEFNDRSMPSNVFLRTRVPPSFN